jgi:hypothetical protein
MIKINNEYDGINIGEYYKYYGATEEMKLIGIDSFNRSLLFDVKGEVYNILFALTSMLELIV